MSQYPHQSIKEWSVEDRPREKLISRGISSLTDAELIAILIGTGQAGESAVDLSKRILGSMQNNLQELGKMEIADLTRFKGIGDAKAITLIAAIELGRRRNHSTALEHEKINGSSDVANYLRPLIGDIPHEEFWVLFMNRQNKVIDKHKLSQGGMTGTVIDVRLVIRKALEKHATAMIVAHNHPSGNLDPSESDRKITKQLKEAAALMELPVLDHLIITQSGHFSFSDEGML